MAKKEKAIKGSLLDRIKNNSTIPLTNLIGQSNIYNKGMVIPTKVPMINVALSGDPDGGLTSGVTVFAGPSKHFKSMFALFMAKCFMDQYPEGILLFYDNEFGTPQKYFKMVNIDMNRVVHIPIATIEEFKEDIVNQLDGFDREDKVFIIVDSIGNLASMKELDDARDGKLVADLTRNRALKSLFRIVTPYLTIKDIPFIVITHSYDTLEMFSKKVVSGGTGIAYASTNTWVIGRQQDKATSGDKELLGYDFIINIEKSRYAKEKSKIPITVNFETGINRWSGLLENALEAGIIKKPLPGKYEYDGKEYKENQIVNNSEFWKEILANTNLKEFLKSKYSIESGGELLKEENDDIRN